MLILTLGIFILLHDAALAATKQATIRRFALITASAEGGQGRVPLRYAHSDAQAVAKVLRELGGVNPADTVVLLDTDRAALEKGIQELGARLKLAQQKDARVELFVYYSGHSDENGLLFGEERVTYTELRGMLDRLLADVRIAVLDSCASGALTRSKGGKQRAPFLIDESANVKGHAFLTSSSADEVSQESDAIAASFFTYFLVSGLRGAADFNRDSRVTLNEAYQFAFQETLARTQKTRGGAQHAAYDISLSGAGDLVLTDLRQTSAALVLSDELQGRVFIRDASGRLVVELNKFAGRSVELGLEPGRYQIVLERGKQLFEAYVQLQNGKQAQLSPGHLTPIEGELTAMRGAGSFTDAVTVAALPPKEYKVIPASFLILPRVSTDGLEGENELNYFSFNFLAGHAARLDGFEISPVGFNSRSDEVNGVQLGVAGNFAGMGWWSHPDGKGDVRGAQVAVGFNATRGRMEGVQLSVGGNVTGGKVEGAQAAVGANVARSVDGLQMAVGFNGAGADFSRDGSAQEADRAAAGLQFAVGANLADGDVTGGQASVGANIATQDARYFQLAVGANFAGGDGYGLQSAVGANFTGGTYYGFQSAIGGNYADRVYGVQSSYGINYGRRLTGWQAATVNVSSEGLTGVQTGLVNVGGQVRGLQLGLINYNEDITGAAIGLLSYSRKQPLRFLAWVDDVNLTNVGLKIHGSKHVYNVLMAGGQPLGASKRWSFGWGIGAHIPFRELYLNVDGLLQQIKFSGDDWENHLAQGRLVAGWRIRERFAIFAGTTYNFHFSQRSSEDFGKRITGLPTDVNDQKSYRLRTWEGFVLGVEI
jgi:hypothetical protein